MKRQASSAKKVTTTSRTSRKTSRVAAATKGSTLATLSAMSAPSQTYSTSAPSAVKIKQTAVASTVVKASSTASSNTASRRNFSNASSTKIAAPIASIPRVKSAMASAAPVMMASQAMSTKAAPSFKAAQMKQSIAAQQPIAIKARKVVPMTAAVAPTINMTPAITAPSMGAFRPSFVALDRDAPPQSLSPQKVVFQAQKFIMNDVAGLQKEFKTDLNDDLDRLGIQVTVNEDGVITATFKRRGFDVEAVFDREFQFPDENDYEDEQYEESGDEGTGKQRRGTGSGSEDDEYDDASPEPYHNISIALMKDGQTLKMGGTLALDGDLRVNSFTPYTKRGEELRTVATEDLSDSTLNALFDALEVICLEDETTNVLLDIARQERLKTHIDALTWMNEFFDGGDYN